MKKRDIVQAIIFSIITCGIYGIYWFICLTDDANRVADEPGTSGGMAFLFGILSCGIYLFYWNYQMGKKLYVAQLKHNVERPTDNSILYLILSLCGLSIVNYCLMQDDLNKYATL